MTLFLVNGVPCIAVENGYRAITQAQVHELVEQNAIYHIEVIDHD